MIRRAAIVLAASGCVVCAAPAPASAGIGSAVCGAVGLVSGLVGKACNAVGGPAGKLIKGVLGGGGGAAAKATRAAGLVAVVAWVVTGARFALRETAKVLGTTTSPKLTSTWFSATYWRTTGIAALLTLPFLFAAAVQALIRSDLSMLVRAAFGYLPIAILATAIAAPLTMLLLAASDEMSAVVSAAAGGNGALTRTIEIGGVVLTLAKSPFLVFAVGLLGVAAALVLWLELVVREAAVYVIVLMLPLAFAAMVWPARRVWAIRGVELLVALILSKFAIVAVLTLGSAAFAQVGHLGIVAALAGVALLMLGACAPWALLRLLPLSELASGAMAPIGRELRGSAGAGGAVLAQTAAAHAGDEDGIGWLKRMTAHMHREASAASDAASDIVDGAPAAGDLSDRPAAPAAAAPVGDIGDPAVAPAQDGGAGGPTMPEPSAPGEVAHGSAPGVAEMPGAAETPDAAEMPGVAEMPGAAETPDLGAAEPASTPPRRKWRPPPGGLPTITFSPEGLAAWPQPQPPPGRAGDADGAEVQPDFPPETTTADDHHPLPPPQDSGDGHL